VAGLRYVAVSLAENDSVRNRVNKNTAVIARVCRSLAEHAQSYRFALQPAHQPPRGRAPPRPSGR
jgi:hypothetical protein